MLTQAVRRRPWRRLQRTATFVGKWLRPRVVPLVVSMLGTWAIFAGISRVSNHPQRDVADEASAAPMRVIMRLDAPAPTLPAVPNPPTCRLPTWR